MTTHVHGILGSSTKIDAVRDAIAMLSRSTLPVVIEGETGVGKELVAAAIHGASRRQGAFVPVNACAIPEAMFESTLFGHVRGAFTGALSRSRGFLLEADRGTIFLDEIGTLGLAEQAKLLRAIETGIFRPIGAERDVRSDFRVVVATNVALRTAVSMGDFRADLAYRLSGAVITVPPLRDRRGDIPELIDAFMIAAPRGRFVIPAAVMDVMLQYEWPGNVRQLRHCISSLSVVAGHRVVDISDLMRSGIDAPAGARRQLPIARARRDEPLRHTVLDALSRSGSDTAAAARLLGVHRATLYRWMSDMDISLDSRRASRRVVQAYQDRALRQADV